MTTLTITPGQLHTLTKGDRITAVDGQSINPPHVVRAQPTSPAGPVPLVNPHGTTVEWNLWPETVGADTFTVERGAPQRDHTPIGGIYLVPEFRMLPGAGDPGDYGLIVARREYRCEHEGPWSRPLGAPCGHPVIAKGERHVITKQGYYERGRVAIECLIGARIIEPTDPPAPVTLQPGAAEPKFRNTPARNDYADRWGIPGRTLNALRRNPRYVDVLLALDATGAATDLRQSSPRGLDPTGASRTCGTLATMYGWTEQAAPYIWRLTDRGRQALTVARREGLL